MTLEGILRAKALDDERPLAWAVDHLAQALRLLEQAKPHLPDETPDDRGLRMAVEYLLIWTTADPPLTNAEFIARMGLHE